MGVEVVPKFNKGGAKPSIAPTSNKKPVSPDAPKVTRLNASPVPAASWGDDDDFDVDDEDDSNKYETNDNPFKQQNNYDNDSDDNNETRGTKMLANISKSSDTSFKN